MQAGEWETFDLQLSSADGGITATLQADKGQYVSAEDGGGGAVNANRDVVGSWEAFTIFGLAAATVHGGEDVNLRTADQAHYVCAEGGGGGEVNATRTAAGDWESFRVEVADQRNSRLQMPSVRKDLGMGHVMVTSSTTSQDGAVRAHTDLTNTNKLFGFTAAAKLIFVDKSGRKLGETGSDHWGIDQAPIIGAAHRGEDWFASAPAGTDDIALLQFWAPKPRFGDILAAIEDVVRAIEVAVALVVEFCVKYPDLCDAVGEYFSSSDGGNEPA